MIKVALVSASPIAATGYGRVTRDIGYRLIDMGFDVTFIGTFGDVIIWGGVTEQQTFKGRKATILSLTDPRSAADVISVYAHRYGFELVIGFMDCFGLEFLNNVGLPVIGYIPIDGPFTDKMRNYMRNWHRVLAFSEYGYGELLKWYPPSKVGYIPHGIDTEVFRPLSEEEYDDAREWFLEAYGVPKGAFLAVDMGANVGPRKLLPLLMRTWSRFAKDRNAHLFIFTNAYAPDRGYDLIAHRINLGMEKQIHFPTYDPIILPAKDDEDQPTPDGGKLLSLRRIFGAADIFVHNACAEGFGLPLAEAMSCGVPPIAPDNSAQTEMIKGNGWLVENVDPDDYIEYPVYVPTLQEYPIPSQRSLLKNLIEAYENPDLVKGYGRKSREFVVRNYSWDVVMPRWGGLLRRTEEELELFKYLREALKAPVP